MVIHFHIYKTKKLKDIFQFVKHSKHNNNDKYNDF